MPTDRFRSAEPEDLIVPARSARAVTPSTTEMNKPPRALYIGTGGDLVVRMLDDDDNVTFVNVPDGTILELRVKLVHTDTTADDILALY